MRIAATIKDVSELPIKIEHVSKSFEGKEVIRNFSLELPEKGIYVLLGASGAGKTTLLRLIAGLDAPDSGHITGTQGKKISFVFQGDRLLPASTAFENIALAASPETAKLWLKRLELDDAADKKPNKLSGGMARRVALARALAFGDDILLLDEPFKGFDSELKKRVIPYITDFAKNALVVLVTHDKQEATIADAVFTMETAL